jgi:glucans biosynthesis protein C
MTSPADDAPRRRLHGLDNLRALMMWLGIVLHVSAIHMVNPSPLPWRDTERTLLADFLMGFIHAFRMPVFFILAGYFTAMLLRQRGAAGMLKHRLLRLGLPFAVFWPPIFAASVVLALLFMPSPGALARAANP